MIIFWRGLGIWVLFALFAWLALVLGIAIAMKGPEADPNAGATTDRLFGIAFALTAGTVHYLARRRERNPRKVVDEATGETLIVPHDDAFMFIRMKYWTYPHAAIAAFLLIKSVFE